MEKKRDYLSNLDLLRFLAALYVVATHYGYIGPQWGVTGYEAPNGWIEQFFRFGYLGVPIFFALSGFLIAHVSQNTDAVRFGANRIFRLMPGFWASMTLSFIMLSVLGSVHEISFFTWVANLILVPQVLGQPFIDGVYWTLVYEFVFYGWATIFIFLGVFHRYILLIGAAWLAIAYGNMFVLENSILDRLMITKFAGSFIIGLALWHTFNKGQNVAASLLIAAATIHLGFALQDVSSQDFLPNPPTAITIYQALALAIGVTGTTIAAIFLPQIKKNVDVLATLGAISYPLYLIHQEIGYAVFRQLNFLNMPVTLALLMTVAMILIAYALHEVCEKPLRHLLQKNFTPFINVVADRVLSINPFAQKLKVIKA